MNIILKFIILVYSLSVTAFAQDRVQLQGTVSDHQTGEPIVRCSVSISEYLTAINISTGRR